MHELWVTILSKTLLWLIQVLVVSFLVGVHRYAPALHRWVDHHTTLTERQVLAQIGKEAFRYAETVFTSSPGQVKLDQALKYAANVAQNKGLKVSEQELQSAIEQAVQDAKQLNVTASSAAGGTAPNSVNGSVNG